MIRAFSVPCLGVLGISLSACGDGDELLRLAIEGRRLVRLLVEMEVRLTEARIDHRVGGTGRLRGAQAFVIQRFDRLASGPVHMEDFAQVFDVYPDDKYKTATMRRVAGVIAAEGADSTEFVRRMVFNALIGNADMHLKNWSLIYPDQRRTALAPAYDFLSTTPYIKDDKSALKVSRSARFDEFTRDELVHFAAKARLPERVVLDTAAETVALFHQQWKSEAKNLPMAKDVIAAVEHQLRIVPIAND